MQAELKQNTEMIAWHNLPLGDVFAQLNSKRDGLSQNEASKRLKSFSANKLTYIKTQPRKHAIFKQFLNPLTILLLAATYCAIYATLYLNAAIILLTAGLNIITGCFEELKTKKYLTDFKKCEIKFAIALRDGLPKQILSSEIVPGDIILLNSGDIVPADARLIKSYALKTDEKILTGSSILSFKNPGVTQVGAKISERTNIIFSGTNIQDGTAEALVFATSEYTAMSRARPKININLSLKTNSFFTKKITKLSRFLSLLAIILSAAAIFWGLIFHIELEGILLVIITVVVAITPLNLPLGIGLILAAGTRNIFKAGGLVRSLATAEILGRVTVILTNKTGILTQGKLYLDKFLTPERQEGILELNPTIKSASNHLLALTYGMLAGNALIENPQDEPHQWVMHANAIEKTLVMTGIQTGLNYASLNKKFKKIYTLPFNNERKFSASVREINAHENWLMVLGSPEILFSQLEKVQIMNRFEKLLPFELNRIKESMDNLAKDGLKILAVCSKKIEKNFKLQQNNEKELLRELNLVGLIGIRDNARAEIKDFLKISNKTGLKIMMVTGDHPLTSRVTAKELGLLNTHHDSIEIMEGRDIDALDATELKRKINSVDVFSHIMPRQKIKLISALQSSGETTALISRDANDAVALERADIGVALMNGSALTRTSADFIMLENSLIILIKAITEGRIILYNIKKIIAYLFSTSLAEIILIGLSLIFSLPLPLIISQIFWINFVNQSLTVVALSVHTDKSHFAALKPIPRSEPIISSYMGLIIAAIGTISALLLGSVFYFLKYYLGNIPYAQSVVFISLGFLTLSYAFSIHNFKKPLWEIRFWKNKYLIWAYLMGIMLLVAAIYLPPLQFILKTQALGFLEWVIAFGVSILSIMLIEIIKWLCIKQKKRHNESYC